MPVTKAKTGFGSLLQRDNGSGTYVTVAGCRDFSGPGRTRTTVDGTHQESPDGYMERIVAMKESGEVTFDLNFDPADTSLALLESDFESGTLRNWRLVIAGASHRFVFSGYVTALTPSLPMNERMNMAVTITLSGKSYKEANS